MGKLKQKFLTSTFLIALISGGMQSKKVNASAEVDELLGLKPPASRAEQLRLAREHPKLKAFAHPDGGPTALSVVQQALRSASETAARLARVTTERDAIVEELARVTTEKTAAERALEVAEEELKTIRTAAGTAPGADPVITAELERLRVQLRTVEEEKRAAVGQVARLRARVAQVSGGASTASSVAGRHRRGVI